MSTDPTKITAMQNWPQPNNFTTNGVLALGVTGYYRRFIQGYGVVQTTVQCIEEECLLLEQGTSGSF
jgi:hypothetical protein